MRRLRSLRDHDDVLLPIGVVLMVSFALTFLWGIADYGEDQKCSFTRIVDYIPTKALGCAASWVVYELYEERWK